MSLYEAYSWTNWTFLVLPLQGCILCATIVTSSAELIPQASASTPPTITLRKCGTQVVRWVSVYFMFLDPRESRQPCHDFFTLTEVIGKIRLELCCRLKCLPHSFVVFFAVALNFQTPGEQMDLNHGRFLQNGQCGYIQKPSFMCQPDITFNSENVCGGPGHRPVLLTVQVR